MANNKRKPPRRMFRTPDRVSRYEHDRSPIGRMKRVAREHEDVLQGIETLFVSRREEDPGVDDRGPGKLLPPHGRADAAQGVGLESGYNHPRRTLCHRYAPKT